MNHHCYPVAAAIFLLAMAVAQAADVTRELQNVRRYFAAQPPGELFKAQALLQSTTGYDGEPDGRWGPRTARAFEDVLDTYISIGGDGPDWGVNRPADTPRLLDWIAQAGQANATGTDFPD